MPRISVHATAIGTIVVAGVPPGPPSWDWRSEPLPARLQRSSDATSTNTIPGMAGRAIIMRPATITAQAITNPDRIIIISIIIGRSSSIGCCLESGKPDSGVRDRKGGAGIVTAPGSLTMVARCRATQAGTSTAAASRGATVSSQEAPETAPAPFRHRLEPWAESSPAPKSTTVGIPPKGRCAGMHEVGSSPDADISWRRRSAGTSRPRPWGALITARGNLGRSLERPCFPGRQIHVWLKARNRYCTQMCLRRYDMTHLLLSSAADFDA